MNIRNPIHTFILGAAIMAVLFLFYSISGCGNTTDEHPLQDSIRAYKDSSAFYKGQGELIRAEKDSLLLLLNEREPRVTYLTKNYYSPVEPKFAISDSDAAALYILNFAEENK